MSCFVSARHHFVFNVWCWQVTAATVPTMRVNGRRPLKCKRRRGQRDCTQPYNDDLEPSEPFGRRAQYDGAADAPVEGLEEDCKHDCNLHMFEERCWPGRIVRLLHVGVGAVHEVGIYLDPARMVKASSNEAQRLGPCPEIKGATRWNGCELQGACFFLFVL